MRIAALDLSLTATGIARNFGDGPSVLTILPGSRRGAERLHFIQKAIDQATESADVVVREGYAFGAKGNALFDIGELGGVIRLTMYCRKRPLVEIPPAVVKKLATGNGNAPKESVLAEAIRRLGYEGNDHNQADALWILQAGLHHYGLTDRVKLPEKHLSALDRVRWPTAKDLVT